MCFGQAHATDIDFLWAQSASGTLVRPDPADAESQAQAPNFPPAAAVNFKKRLNQYNQHVCRAGCLSLGTVIASAGQFFVVTHCPVRIGRLSTPGPCSLDATSSTSPLLWQQMSPNVTWGRKSLWLRNSSMCPQQHEDG